MNWKHFLVLAALAPTAAFGQARVVTTCGSLAPFGPQPAGSTAYVTQDTNGQLCLSGGGSGGGGISSLTAGTTPTTGFTAGQMLMSDGSLLQAVMPVPPAAIFTDLGASAQHLYMGVLANGGIGGYNSILFSNQKASYGSGVAIHLGSPSFHGVLTDANGFFGIISGTNNLTGPNPDVALVTDNQTAIAKIRDIASPTSPLSFRTYNTYTDNNNGEWGALDWQTTPNVLTIGTGGNGTGQVRGIQIVSGGVPYFDINRAYANYVAVGGSGIVPSSTSQTIGTSGVPWAAAYSNAYIASGTQPTITGCTAGTKVGGSTAGTFQLGAACAAAATLVFTGLPAAPTGYACDAMNRSLPAMLAQETASTTTGFTLTVAGTSGASGNVIQWKCLGY